MRAELSCSRRVTWALNASHSCSVLASRVLVELSSSCVPSLRSTCTGQEEIQGSQVTKCVRAMSDFSGGYHTKNGGSQSLTLLSDYTVGGTAKADRTTCCERAAGQEGQVMGCRDSNGRLPVGIDFSLHCLGEYQKGLRS